MNTTMDKTSPSVTTLPCCRKRPREEDEDTSSSSDSTSSSSSEQRPRRGRKGYRVSISQEETRCYFNPEAPRSEYEKQLSWYQPSEFLMTRMSVRDTCRGFRKTRRYSDCLSQVYDTACHLASSSDEEEDTDGTASDSEPTNEPTKEPSTKEPANKEPSQEPKACPSSSSWMSWVRQGPAARGLEQYSSQLHAMRRAQHLKEAYRIVAANKKANADANLLAAQARQASRRARHFAALLGQADAWAAQQAHGEDDNDTTEEEDESSDE